MTTATDLHALVAKYVGGPMMAALEGAKTRADRDGDDAKLAYGRYMADIVDNQVWPVSIRMEPEDIVTAKKLLLRYFEELAETGHVVAMRYAACGYANGDNHREVTRTDTGWRISAAPDFAKACDWARKAGAAGDAVAQKILPGLEDDLAAQTAKAPAPPKP